MGQLMTDYSALGNMAGVIRAGSYRIADEGFKYRQTLDTVVKIMPNIYSDAYDVFSDIMKVSESLDNMAPVLKRVSEMYGNADEQVKRGIDQLADTD